MLSTYVKECDWKCSQPTSKKNVIDNAVNLRQRMWLKMQTTYVKKNAIENAVNLRQRM